MLERRLLQDVIIEQLRSFIYEHRTNEPVRIESERALAKRFNVSRLSLRAAIQDLANEGLLDKRHGSGTYILPKTKFKAVHLLLAPDIKRNDPFYSSFLGELSYYLAQNAADLRVINPEFNRIRPSDALLIILGLCDSTIISQLQKSYRYIISTQSYPDQPELTQVFFDDYRIGFQAASILAMHGHQHVIYLSGPEIYSSAQERRRGFLAGIASVGADVKVIEGKMNWSSGYELGSNALQLIHTQVPTTAVFAANDWMALGLMQRLLENKVRIPQDISVIGCDDIHLATEFTPNLATFRWSMHHLIKEMFTMFEAMIVCDQPSKRTLLSAEFINRESIGQRG